MTEASKRRGKPRSKARSGFSRKPRLPPDRQGLLEAAEHIENHRYLDGLEALETVLRIDPNDTDALYFKAAAEYRLAQRDSALATVRHLLDCKPSHVHGMNLIANIYQDFAEFAQAETWYRRAIEAEDGEASLHNNLGTLLRFQGRHQEAIAAFDAALQRFPAYPEALTNKANALLTLHRPLDAQALYRQALELEPTHVRAWTGMGKALERLGATEEAVLAFDEAHKLAPDDATIRWNRNLLMPIVPTSEQEIQSFSRRLLDGVHELVGVSLDRPEVLEAELMASAERTAFCAHYRDEDQTELQRTLGRYMVDLVQTAFPGYAGSPFRLRNSKVRVGYVGYHMFEHTVGKFVEGWARHHDPEQFDVSVYHMGHHRDERTHAIAAQAPIVELKGHVGQMAERLNDEKLDVIVYPELGMYGPTLQLASLRLAPLQCVHLGHPVTTGLDTIDYFLSGELIEPEDGQNHYHETLHRLPGFGICYDEPTSCEPPLTRSELALPEDKFVFLSAQSVFKYQPQDDELYAKVLARNPNIHIAFLSSKTPTLEGRFVARMRRACRKHGVVFDNRCSMIGRRPYRDFLRIYPAVDAMLDVPTWSGGNTTLEGLMHGTPVVTLPGRYMRSRLTSGILQTAGATDTIARDQDHYVELAHRLVEDETWASKVKAELLEAKPQVFARTDVVRAAERLYLESI